MLKSKSINLRLIEESDAAFVLGLRLNNQYNMFLSKVGASLQDQISWIKNYKQEELLGNQFYFIIERKDGTPCGTVRIYDLRDDSFCWGSWILNEDKTRYSALESALLVYDFGFNSLNYNKSHFDVMKGNEKVLSFHRKLGAVLVSEDEDNFYYTITRAAIEENVKKFKAFLAG